MSPASEQLLVGWTGPLPEAYLAFLHECDGAEWGIHDAVGSGDCLCLWSADIIPEYNDAYSIQKWLPEAIALGSDGGDDAILLDRAGSTDPNAWPVVRVGFGALDRDEFRVQAPSFRAWALDEFRLRRDPPPEFDLPSRTEMADGARKVADELADGDEPF